MIKIKNETVLASLLMKKFDRQLIAILVWLNRVVGDIVITEGYRVKKHPNDVHGTDPVRAVDLRSWVFEDPVKVRDMINHYWIYDTDRPNRNVCVYHDVGRGMHFHIQVHPNTRRR